MKSGHVMKKYSELGHRNVRRRPVEQYCVSGWLSLRTFAIQKEHINEMDIVLCHPTHIQNMFCKKQNRGAQANRNQKKFS